LTLTDDTKEWVTVKIPKAERDAAQDDPRTYGDIMRAGLEQDTTGTQDLDAQEIAATIRQELGFDGDPENVADVDALAEAVADRIDTHTTVTLEASEYSNIADEIQGRLR
jgi:hypothetical protein